MAPPSADCPLAPSVPFRPCARLDSNRQLLIVRTSDEVIQMAPPFPPIAWFPMNETFSRVALARERLMAAPAAARLLTNVVASMRIRVHSDAMKAWPTLESNVHPLIVTGVSQKDVAPALLRKVQSVIVAGPASPMTMAVELDSNVLPVMLVVPEYW